MLAAYLRKIAARGDAQLGGKRLEKYGHQARNKHGAQQGVAKLRAAAQVGGPIPRIHVSDSNQVARPRKGEHFPEERSTRQNGDGAVRLGKRGKTDGLSYGSRRRGKQLGWRGAARR